MISTDDLTSLIDEALERFRGRDLVSGAEVVDLLLDLRIKVLADDGLEQLLDEVAAAPVSN